MKVESQEVQLAEENKALLEENKQLYDSIARLTMLQESALALTSDLNLDRVLAHAVRCAAEIVDARSCKLFLIDETARDLVLMAVHGRPDLAAKTVRQRTGQGIVGWVAAHGKPLVVNDVPGDRRFVAGIDASDGLAVKSIIGIPLNVKGKIIGVIEVIDKQSGEFSHDDFESLVSIGCQAAIGIENARLFQVVSEEKNRSIVLLGELRKKLARDLHDGPAQALAAITMNIDYVKKLVSKNSAGIIEELESLRLLSSRTMRDVRNLLFELRPLMLETQGLVPTLQSLINRLQEPEGLKFHLRSDDSIDRLDRNLENSVFSIVQEAVNNTIKHAKAENIWIKVACREGLLLVSVEDDGQGFDLGKVQANYESIGSFGLLNMRERASLAGGSFTITPIPGRGTTINIQIPVH